jgi:hypothetical protein
MSRKADLRSLAVVEPIPVALPAIDWSSIGKNAPQPVTLPHRQSTAPLPKADIVVLTWTDAEWSALDHVFANSGTTRGNGLGAWDKGWLAYTRDTAGYSSGEATAPLWGMFRVVTVAGTTKTWTVLIFHSNAHLQYQPYIQGLRAMVKTILADTRGVYLYSIGTAGAGALDQRLGDPVLTNAAQLLAGTAPNDKDPANGKIFTCNTWYPPTALFAAAQTLMFALSKVVTQSELHSLFERFANKYSVGSLQLADLLNAPLQPANLGAPKIHSLQGKPLNTSCDFAMAPGAGSPTYAAYEEDDAAVGQAAQEAGVAFAFMRNVSDTVVPDHTAAGTAIPLTLRQNWASLLYDRYGLITAFNGALATWAAIAAS